MTPPLISFLDRQYWLSGHCHLGLHDECYPAIGTSSECECSCHRRPQ